MLRNARTFERLKKMIIKGAYDKEELILDITDFLEIGTLTEEEFAALLVLIEENPPISKFTYFDEGGSLISDNTYLLLHKQIIKMIYTAETIEQMLTDFRITDSITREQFKTLMNLIEDVYFPVIEEVEEA